MIIDIILNKDGFRDTFGNKIDDENLFLFWRANFKISDDAPTLKEFLNILKNNPIFFSVIQKMNGCDLDPYIDELEQESEKQTTLLHLEISKQFSVFCFDYNPDETNIDAQLLFSGISSDERFALEFTPLSEIKDLKVKLNHNHKIYYSDYEKQSKQSTHKEMCGNSDFIFGETVLAILSELTFFGSPKNRDNQMMDLKERIENIDNENFISSDEFFEKLKNRFKQ